ncbi:GTP pyrophosphokinase [Desulfosediminicola sp.]|uniref:GTP pyrophosphokinase n=1 Tax=Desulfosediminicola sp. TaxID=2886825 RepID=UPI003AF30091
MASLDFETEKVNFRQFYDSNRRLLVEAMNSYINIINAQIKRFDNVNVGEIPKVEGRIKSREECIKKFHRKYLRQVEAAEHPYEIQDFISDLIGIRIVCLYEDQIDQVYRLLEEHFKVLDVTDKISSMESTEHSFGYKGLHLDLALNDEMAGLPKYHQYAGFSFEVQIRSLIQDAWSVLDHKIKYKKSIPSDLKRRINILAALFELADREFKEIRNATTALIQQETVQPVTDLIDDARQALDEAGISSHAKSLNAFNFLRIAGHFFRDFEFVDYKVDGFVHDILRLDEEFQKSELHKCLIENLKTVREYREKFLQENPDKTFSPYTSIRHSLFLHDREKFDRILSRRVKERFLEWLDETSGERP